MQTNDVLAVATQSFAGGLKDQATSGNISKLTSAFNGNKNDATGIMQDVMKYFIPQLISSLAISENKAGSIANIVIPFLMEKFCSNESGRSANAEGFISKYGIGGVLFSGLGNKAGGFLK